MVTWKWIAVFLMACPIMVSGWFHFPEEGEDRRRFCGDRLSTALMILCNPKHYYPPESIDRWVVRRRPMTTKTPTSISTSTTEPAFQPKTTAAFQTITPAVEQETKNTAPFEPKTTAAFQTITPAVELETKHTAALEPKTTAAFQTITPAVELETKNKSEAVPMTESLTTTEHQLDSLPKTREPGTTLEQIARMRRGVVDECCRRACTIQELAQWCG